MRFKFVVWAVLCAVALGAGEVTPASAASFDCAKAATAVEKSICENEGLSQLDEMMTGAYKAQLAAHPNDPSIRNAQATWLQERNTCADDYCLLMAYLDRLKVLERGGPAASQSRSTADAVAKCMASIERYQRAFAMSYAAKICSIRGDRHMVVFDNARRAIFNGPACQAIAPKDIEAGLDRIFVNEVGKIGMRNNDSSSWDQACRRLRGSPDILRELDATFRELTVGYR
jgi:uncharacterized protein